MWNSVSNKIISILGSKKFLCVIIAVLVLGAGWIAITASYPMAFDESFHLGIIQLYAHQVSPILTSVPASSAGQFGELTHDPSYLYHYLMSFPYRLIELLTKDFVTQVIIMRFINIALFAGGIVAFRKLLIRIGASSALTNFSLLMLVLLPVAPFLAAHINYDNMLFLLLPINLWFVLGCVQSITNKSKVDARDIILMLSLGALTSLVKYVYLPIFAASVIYVIVLWLWNKKRSAILHSVLVSFKSMKTVVKVGLIVALVISTGLFMQRYGVNIVMYHDVQPDCAKVETVENCLKYGPWARNYGLEAAAQSATTRPTPMALPVFLVSWVNALIYKLYFAINYDFTEYAPMPLPFAMAYIVGIIGVFLVAFFWRSILKVNKHILLFVTIIAAYALSLIYVNYTEYLRFDKIVAVNGRYFMPLLPFIFIIIGLACRRLLAKFWPLNMNVVKGSLVVLATLVALQGGGAMTYLIHSEPVWYWKNDPLTSFNTSSQKIITSLVIGAKK